MNTQNESSNDTQVFKKLSTSAGKSVARVIHLTDGWKGTGYLISKKLFITNNHIIPDFSAARDFVAEFNFELNKEKEMKKATRFELSPKEFFMTSPEDNLDFSIVAVGEPISGNGKLSSFGFCPLTNDAEKFEVGKLANIIGHPRGRPKEVLFHKTKIVAWSDQVILYFTEGTEVGSSGSPVLDDDWRPMAIHHWAAPTRKVYTSSGKSAPANVQEGIRISAIINEIKLRKHSLTQNQRMLIDDAVSAHRFS